MITTSLDSLLKPVKGILSIFLKLMKILFFVAIFFSVILVVLGNLGGSNDNLKRIIEDYASEASGYKTTVESLNEFRFFPTIIVDFQGLEMKQDDTAPVMGRVESLRVSMSFFSAILGTGEVKSFDIKNLTLEKDIALPKKITIDTAKIVDDASEVSKANFVVNGRYGDDDVDALISLAASGSGNGRQYGLGDKRFLKAALGNASAALFMEQDGSVTRITDVDVNQDGKTILAGNIDIKSGFSNRYITGDLYVGSDTQVQPDVKIDSNNKISGDIIFPQLSPQELGTVMAAIGGLQQKFAAPSDVKKAPADIDLSALNMDLNLDLQSIVLNKASIGHQKATIVAENGAINVFVGDGKILTGDHTTRLSLTPVGDEGQHSFKLTTTADNLSIKSLLSAMGSALDIDFNIDGDVDLGASIKTFDDLKDKMTGHIAFVSEGGVFESRALNAWGGGLLSLITPNFKPQEEARLNCMLMTSDIQQGYASAKTLFFDTKRVLVTGTGGYNLLDDNLDLKIKPKTKDISIGDISAAVNIKGSLAKPRVSADKVDVGKSAAGLLLGAVNPALFALSADVGIFDSKKKTPDLCAGLKTLPAGNKASAYWNSIQ